MLFVDTTIIYISVKHAYEGQFRITNHAWDSDLEDNTSEKFTELSTRLEDGISEMLVPAILNNEAEFHVSVVNFTQGSIIVHYR